MHEMGPHSSELAVLFAKENGIPCRDFFFPSPFRHGVTNGGRTAVEIGGVPPLLFRQVVQVGGS